MRKSLIGNQWDNVLSGVLASSEYAVLREFLKKEYSTKIIYPAMENIYNALKLVPPEQARVVILGQDPYVNPNQAHGLSFSVQSPAPPPPSLVNIFKEVGGSGCDGDLTRWAKQGVLLLNSVLTVRAGQPNSHKGKGWEMVTSAVIRHLIQEKGPRVFMLWGNNAKGVYDLAFKTAQSEGEGHLVLRAAHPSPLSAYNGFFGCGHFVKANEFLKEHGEEEIDWS